MDLGLTDKVAIVTGGSAGIGRATALALVNEGAKVAIAARNEQRLQQTLAELQAVGGEGIAIVADLTQIEDVQNVVTQTIACFGRIDILVNNAGSAI